MRMKSFHFSCFFNVMNSSASHCPKYLSSFQIDIRKKQTLPSESVSINFTTKWLQRSQLATLTLKEFFASKSAPKIVSLCGSQRNGSFNKIVHDYAVSILEENGAIVTPIDLHALNLPLYNPNDESEAFPDNAKMLKTKLVESDGIFIASPEYNGFTSPLFLNAITWATRREGNMYDGFKGKVVAVMGTSPGPLGGMRMIRTIQGYFQDMGAVVVPGNNSIGSSFTVFENGQIKDERTRKKIEVTCGTLVQYCRYEANREHDCAIAKELMKLHNMGEYGEVDLPK